MSASSDAEQAGQELAPLSRTLAAPRQAHVPKPTPELSDGGGAGTRSLLLAAAGQRLPAPPPSGAEGFLCVKGCRNKWLFLPQHGKAAGAAQQFAPSAGEAGGV